MNQHFETEILDGSNETALVIASLLLKNHEICAFPTETVYGLAGNIYSSQALEKIFLAKERPASDPLIVHIGREHARDPLSSLKAAEILDVDSFTTNQKKVFLALARQFWPGPLSLILPKHPNLSLKITSGLPKVALRMPSHPVALDLLDRCGFSLAAPSANRFGQISPTRAIDTLKELSGRIPLILDGGPCRWGLESTVCEILDDGYLKIHRKGSLSAEAFSDFQVMDPDSADTLKRKVSQSLSPGQLAKHYAPRKPFFRLPAPLKKLTQKDIKQWAEHRSLFSSWALLTVEEENSFLVELIAKKPLVLEYLCTDMDSEVAALHLYATLRRLDESDADVIYSEPIDHKIYDQQLWPAIGDRINRASVSFVNGAF